MVGIRRMITFFILVIFLGDLGYIFNYGILSMIKQENSPFNAFSTDRIHDIIIESNVKDRNAGPFFIEEGKY